MQVPLNTITVTTVAGIADTTVAGIAGATIAGNISMIIGIIFGMMLGVLLNTVIKSFLSLLWKKIINACKLFCAIIIKSVWEEILGENWAICVQIAKDTWKEKFGKDKALRKKTTEIDVVHAKYAIGSEKGINQEPEEYLLAAANKGDMEAQCNLGVAYYHGNGVNKSIENAVLWFDKAAKQELAVAQFNLGICYDDDNSKEIDEDKIEAGHWYRKAAEQGHVQAQFNLGSLYYWNDKDVIANKRKAYTWLIIAKLSGDKKAEKWLNEKQWNFLLTPDKMKHAQQKAEETFSEIKNQ